MRISLARPPNSKYRLTVYVDEHSTTFGIPTGHVFIGLSNQQREIVLGYQGDDHVAQVHSEQQKRDGGYYDVSKTYEISEQAYHAALAKAGQWNKLPFNENNSSDSDHHCGVFAEDIAHASGLTLEGLRQTPDNAVGKLFGPNPPVWGKYLRTHGGSLHKYGTPPVKDEQKALDRDLTRKWTCAFPVFENKRGGAEADLSQPSGFVHCSYMSTRLKADQYSWHPLGCDNNGDQMKLVEFTVNLLPDGMISFGDGGQGRIAEDMITLGTGITALRCQ